MSGGEGLRGRVLRGGLWAGLSYFATRALAFTQTVILARLLLPDDFGLMGVGMFAVGAFGVFTQTGVDLALIRRPDVARRDLDTGWVICVLRGGALFAAAFLSAPLVAQAFGEARAGSVLRALSLLFLIEGFVNIGVVAFRRDLDFRRQTMFEQVSEALTTAVTVGVAFFITRSVWALVAGQVAGALAKLAASYALSPFRPAFRFDREAFRGIAGYGWHVTVTGILLFLLVQGDNAFVGRYLGVAALGVYALAYNLANLPASGVSGVVGRLAFPVYARMQGDPEALREGYLRSVRGVVLLTLPASIVLLTLAPDLVGGLYGEGWVPAIPVVQVLSLFGFLRAFNTAPGQLLQAAGHPGRLKRVMLVQLVLFAAILYPMGRAWGITGVGAAVTAANLVASFLIVREVGAVTGAGFGAHLRVLWPAVLPGVAMGGAVRAAADAGGVWWARAGAGAGAGLIVYFVVLLITDPALRRGVRARMMGKK
jgi:PST family polysaccharide transporter/lipopolysaccharide exporter